MEKLQKFYSENFPFVSNAAGRSHKEPIHDRRTPVDVRVDFDFRCFWRCEESCVLIMQRVAGACPTVVSAVDMDGHDYGL